MTRFLLALAIATATSLPAIAQQQPQPPKLTLALEPNQMQIIWDQLGEMPWKRIDPLMQEIARQVQAQRQAPAAEAPAGGGEPKPEGK